MFAAEIGRLAGVRVPIVPVRARVPRHAAVPRARRRGRARAPADAARPRPADLLPRGGRRPDHGRLRARVGAVGARRAPARRDPAGLQRAPARGGLAALRGDREELLEAGAGDGRDHGDAPDQRPGGVHPRQRVLPRRERGARVLRRRGLLRARPRRRGRHRPGDGRVDPRRASPRSTCGRWTSGASARTSARPATRSSARKEVYETYYDIRYPGHERLAGRPLRTSSAYPWHAEHGAAFGEKSGWERVNWYERNAPAGRGVAAPARLGGDALVAGDRRRAPRHARAGGAVRRVLVREARGRRARARPRSCSGCATTTSRARWARSPTRRCSTATAASSATSPSRASRRSCSRSSPARPSATTTSAGYGATHPRTAACAAPT